MKSVENDIIFRNRIFVWIALATAVVLAIPLIAMKFSSEVNWGPFDFGIMAMLLFGMGSMFVLTARRFRSTQARVIIGAVFLLAFLYIWTELAVGILTSWGS